MMLSQKVQQTNSRGDSFPSFYYTTGIIL